MSSKDEVTNKQVEMELGKITDGLKEVSKNKCGPGLCGWMFLIFLTLKLTNVINWSWWWVTAPLWIPFSIVLFLLILMLIVFAFASSAMGSDTADDTIEAEVVDEKKE